MKEAHEDKKEKMLEEAEKEEKEAVEESIK